jgi:hypothetical protein
MTFHLRALGVAIISSALVVDAADAAGKFDGPWNVQVRTEAGDCQRAYEVPVVVENGKPRYGGAEGFPLAGSVSPTGVVRVSIALGQTSAEIAGRLSQNSGSGKWQSGSRSCSGSWSANKSG